MEDNKKLLEEAIVGRLKIIAERNDTYDKIEETIDQMRLKIKKDLDEFPDDFDQILKS